MRHLQRRDCSLSDFHSRVYCGPNANGWDVLMIGRRFMLLRVAAFLVLSSVLFASAGAASAPAPGPDELALGNRFYKRMLHMHRILPATAIEESVVTRVGNQIATVSNPMYGVPFAFYTTDGDSPDAFVAVGPQVYVNRGLVHYVENADELAAVMCHEMSHDIHHDGMNSLLLAVRADAITQNAAARAKHIMRGHFARAIDMATNLTEMLLLLHHSRMQEERADLTGATICATAGFNPWGFVWLLEKMNREYGGSRQLRWLSDHPDNAARIKALRHEFSKNRAVFGKFRNDEAIATPLV